jgi:hypothetical protein
MRSKNNMLKKEDVADAYAEATDSTRQLVRVARSSDRQEQRVKPDLETHPEAALDHEELFLRFSLFDVIPLPPLHNDVHPGIELLDEATVAEFV